ncbi:recombinase family protein [Ralstonia pickettii]|jgi:DNA invertase Pin-like site-specific DNA recombinase|uniref:Recombinase family protein n=1 Tax=Ralstonia pickettii TaxID=329 RepID=A0A7X2HLU2_RALPI|nr:recombinase family protein [Ralstonia pickettii]MRS98910.1 recombinase family protein [Ralstonia pickettii]
MKRGTLACAIYTRKSSEEGLEQGFNSLDAQREACEAYVLSQQHEGWHALATHYDDGGFSGGTMERPALQRLLADVQARRIRIVVVYKVDRLTRSLADFAKIVEQFDAHGVSFVSVTQQFNTTSSMGRLTLNVLLSFAQFEREVTGERIRDKIAASKQKGMWMGGMAPIGYCANDRTLKVEPEGAALVERLYARYLALGSVRELKDELDRDRIVTPLRVSSGGRAYGGRPFSRGQLYRILSSPVYLGKIQHKDQVHAGQHPAIIEKERWAAVQAQLLQNRQGHRERQSSPSTSLLAGRLVDHRGRRLIPSHSQKRVKRYRYYVSEPLINQSRDHAPDGLRLPAQELETVVVNALRNWLVDTHAVLQALSGIPPERVQGVLAVSHRLAKELDEAAKQYSAIQRLVQQVVVEPQSVQVIVQPHTLLVHEATSHQSPHPTVTLAVPVQIRRCGLAMRLLVTAPQPQRREPDARLIALQAKAQRWLEQLTSGKTESIADIAKAEGVTRAFVLRVIYRTFLAPDIVRAMLDGTQPPGLTSDALKQSVPLPIDWGAQRKLLGFAPA